MIKIMNPKFILFLIFVTFIGVVSVLFVANLSDKKMRSELLAQAEIAAHSINIEKILSLSGSKNDLDRADYQRIKSQLQQIRKLRDKYKFIYLMGQTQDKSVFFFVDSQSVESKDYAPPGLIYKEVSDAYLHVFDTAKEAVVGPITDRWGTSVTALIPLKNPHTGKTIAVLGMDITAGNWNNSILLYSTIPFAIIMLFIISIILLVLKKRSTLSYVESEERHKQFFENAPIGIIHYDNRGTVTDVNDAMISILGSSHDEVVGISVDDLQNKVLADAVSKSLEGKAGHYEGEYTSITGSRTSIIKADLMPIIHNGKVSSGVAIAEDISEQKKIHKNLLEQKKKLKHLAHHDALTDLPNRLLFDDRLEQSILKSKRSGKSTAVLFIDLDHFKEINDSLGHKVGDKVLKAVTERLNAILRREDTLARLGGDEFTVVMGGLNQGQNASLLAQKILEALSLPFMIEEHELYVSSSIGISLYPEDGTSAQDLLKYADAAMYKAKDEGRNNFQFYSAEMTELAFERVVMEASLRSALKEEDFVVYYQPQVDGKTDKLIGMEALVRWNHSTMGIVSPAKFIPLAESTGLIVELDKFVMKTAMLQMAAWYKKGLKPGVLAMNLVVKLLQQKDFTSMFESLLKETGCKAEWIELEVAEGQIMTDPEKAIKVLKHISNIGIELAIDDFGTGYSSLAYLKKLPIDKLKIDQSFVRDLPKDEEDIAITKAVIALSKSLNLKIIAEGVETADQRDFLVKNGCESIQGYLYSKPVPAYEMEVMLQKGFKRT